MEEVLRWGWLARVADRTSWDDNGWRITARQLQLARETGALGQLPFLLNQAALDAIWHGDLAAAASLIAEADAVGEATGSGYAPYAAMMLASFRGNQAEAAPLIQAAHRLPDAGHDGHGRPHLRPRARPGVRQLGFEESPSVPGQRIHCQ